MKRYQPTDCKPVTVFLSCVGRMTSLVREFQSALPPGGKVITADTDHLAAGAAVADGAYVAPRLDSPDYENWVLSVCKRESVSLLISLLPEELLRLEHLRAGLTELGVQLVGMPPALIGRCLDKRLHDTLCSGTGFRVPPRWRLQDIERIPITAYPLIAKEADGKGSRGMVRLANAKEAVAAFEDLRARNRHNAYFLQPHLEGQEYGLDLVNDLDGQPCAVFIRRKLRMRDGETEIAETVNDANLESAGKALATKLAHQGLVDCDVMRCEDADYLLDINPRFGGGYTFSHEAGASIPAALIAWLRGETPKPEWLAPKAGITSARIGNLQRLGPAGRRFAIITTGSREIGMGHAVRQLSIATTAKRNGHLVTLLTDSGLVAEQAARAKIETITLTLHDKRVLESALADLAPDVVIIDVHEREIPRYSSVADHWKTVLVVSRVGYGEQLYGTSAILVGEDLGYWKTERQIRSHGPITNVHAGRAFVFFRDEFSLDSIRPTADRDSTVLIAHGGSDPHRLTQKCLKAIELTRQIYRVKVLAGPAFDTLSEITTLAERSKHHCEVISGEPEVSQHMAEASIALINGGNVRYELCLTGTPFIAISFQERQFACTEQLTELGVGINLGVHSQLADLRIAEAVDQLMNDPEARDRMGDKMRVLFDMRGTERVIQTALEPS